MTKQEKTSKIKAMKALMAEYNRTGNVVLRDQMASSIANAKATW